VVLMITVSGLNGAFERDRRPVTRSTCGIPWMMRGILQLPNRPNLTVRGRRRSSACRGSRRSCPTSTARAIKRGDARRVVLVGRPRTTAIADSSRPAAS
jgi:hypothetical protein